MKRDCARRRRKRQSERGLGQAAVSVRGLPDVVPRWVVVAHPDLEGDVLTLARRVAAADKARVAPDDLGVVTAAVAVQALDAGAVAALAAADGAVVPAGVLGDPARDGFLAREGLDDARGASQRDVLSEFILVAVFDGAAALRETV